MAGRRLTAILAADIAGYSTLMGENDLETVADLKGHQSAVLPMISGYNGRVIDTAGDGILAEFPSVFNAVKCAVAIQEVMRERNASVAPDRRMQFRIGVNQGDVLFDDNRIYGDGINIAARLEGLCEPGGICISSKVYDEIKGRFEIDYEDIGDQTLRNIASPVRVFRINLAGTPINRRRSPTSVRAWQDPRWLALILVVAIVLGSALTWWGLRSPPHGKDSTIFPQAGMAEQHSGKQEPSKSAAADREEHASAQVAVPAVSPSLPIAPLICGSGQVELSGKCVYPIASEERIRAQAVKQDIVVPATFGISEPDPSIPTELAAYVGAWGGENRWGGVGRQLILVVSYISSSGEAYGYYCQGPPNKNTENQSPAAYKSFVGSITKDGLQFDWGPSKFTFLRGKDDAMTGYVRGGPKGGVGSIKVQRLN